MLDSLGGEPSVEVDKEVDGGVSFDSHRIIVVTSMSKGELSPRPAHLPLPRGWVRSPRPYRVSVLLAVL